MEDKKRFISQDALKIIALITMLIDHIGASIIKDRYDYILATAVDYKDIIDAYRLYCIFRVIGRIAFPIFAYLLVQGFFKTHSRIRYLISMAVFAVISELPYDLAFNEEFMTKPFEEQNVFLTLTLGLLMLCLIDLIGSLEPIRENYMYGVATACAIFALFCYLADLAKCDYSYRGIIIIFLIWALWDRRLLMCLITPASYCFLHYVDSYIEAKTDMERHYVIMQAVFYFVSFALIFFTNDKRRIRGKVKYLFYLFYPVHITVLYFIRTALR